MNMFEEARALYGTIQMCGLTQDEIAGRLGVSQSYIANKLRLLKFSSAMQQRILDSGLCERQARALLRIGDEGLQSHLLSEIKDKHMTVSQTEQLVDEIIQKTEIRAPEHSDLDRGLASCLSLLRLYGTVREHRVTEDENEVILTVRMGR